MDLVTLLSVCTLGFDPSIMQGISIVQSEGKPYVYKEAGKIYRFNDIDAIEQVTDASLDDEQDEPLAA